MQYQRLLNSGELSSVYQGQLLLNPHLPGQSEGKHILPVLPDHLTSSLQSVFYMRSSVHKIIRTHGSKHFKDTMPDKQNEVKDVCGTYWQKHISIRISHSIALSLCSPAQVMWWKVCHSCQQLHTRLSLLVSQAC